METRERPRIDAKLKVDLNIDESFKDQITLVGGNNMETETCDINLGGLCLILKYFLPRGLIVNLSIDGTPFGLDRKIDVKAEIRHSKYVKVHTYKTGVRFLDLSEEDRKYIDDFISKYLEEHKKK